MVSYLLCGVIKRHILLYNEQARRRLTRSEKSASHTAGATRQHSTGSPRSADRLYRRPGAQRHRGKPPGLRSPTAGIDYYELHEIDAKTSSVDAFGPGRLGSRWSPAAGSMIIVACCWNFQGFKHMRPGRYHDGNYIAMVGAWCGWPPCFIKTLPGGLTHGQRF